VPERDSFSREISELKAKPSPVRARILWPALGFPSVIAPADKESTNLFPEGDATRCICVLLLSNKENLSEEEAALYLRYVPWEKRHFSRHIPYRDGQVGTFRKEDLKVIRPSQEGPMDKLSELVLFGANRKGENGILASLAKRVRQFYRDNNFKFLHEIRLNETASRRLKKGLYHLFWNNESVNENVPSDEMSQLIHLFVLQRRKQQAYLRSEYEYEYGSLHMPYKLKHGGPGRRFRSEILHPLFVRDRPAALRIGHLTDTHVDVRADVYEENLKHGGPKPIVNAYNNWNKNFVKIYSKAKSGSDMLLLTGDLIDYGRGFIGAERRQDLADDGLYNSDRNWLLFYYLLASDLGSDKAQYSIPVYTSLGNHDWRLNPYPPFAFAGAPSPRALFDEDYLNKLNIGRPKDMEGYLKLAHGPGHHLLLSYDKSIVSKWQHALETVKEIGKAENIIDALRRFYTVARTAVSDKDKLLFKLLKGDPTLDVKGFPTETQVESVEWYLLSINPFLNYQFTFPGGYNFLMLDWEEDENVVFDSSNKGILYGWGFSTDEGPKARNCLTALQKKLVENLLKSRGEAKIIGIHSPPIGPWHDWYDYELLRGWNEFELGGRGYQFYRAKLRDGKAIQGHPFFATRPKKGVVKDAVYGMDAIYGSFEKERDWFIRLLADQKYHVRLVLSGHIHRQGLFVTYKLNVPRDSSLFDELLIKSIDPIKTSGLSTPAGTNKFGSSAGPLYINSTSIGPRGHLYRSKDQEFYIPPGYTYIEVLNNGSIDKVVFRSL
jgi:calcineurin-like phosphoesterase family protein